MKLTPDDDYVHTAGAESSWQENYLFMGVGDDHTTAMFVHVARLRALDACDVKLLVKIGDDVCSFTEHHQWSDGLDVPGFSFDIAEPWVRWRVSAVGSGMMGGSPGLLVTTGRGDIPISVDFSWEARIPPVIQSEGFEALDEAGSGSSGDHYIQGGRWSGTVSIGEHKVDVSGWSIRDHTWGERHVPSMDYCWWTPMVFDDGMYELAGIDMHTTDGERATFSFERDAERQVRHAFLDVEVTAGDVTNYTRTTIRCGDAVTVEATRLMRLPIAYYRGGGVGWVSDDALCTLTTADGRRGFGIIELNRLLTDDEISALPKDSNGA